MRLTRRQFIAASAASAVSAPSFAAGLEKGANRNRAFRRGGAIHTMMNWGALEDGDPGNYLPRPFEAPRNVFPAELVSDFALSGFDYIRLSVDVGPFMQLRGGDREALERKLLHNIGLFHQFGLDVIVDCHPVEQVETYSVFSVLDDLQSPGFAAYANMVARLAGLLSGVRTGRVALELMNEPALRHASHRAQVRVWSAAQLALHDAARRGSADLPLVLTGADYGGVSGLTDLDPTPYIDSNTLFSFHYYMPLSFTHQGIDVGSTDYDFASYVVDLPYPYDALSPDEIAGRLAARINEDPRLDSQQKAEARTHANRIFGGFLDDAWDREKVERDVGKVAEWAADYRIGADRIVLGECGATRRSYDFVGAPTASRHRWLSDLTAVAEAHGFGWAVWEINGREFGIQRVDDETRVDRDVLAAVGLVG